MLSAPLFVMHTDVTALQQERPLHQALIMVVHLRQEHKGVMVGVHQHGVGTGAHIQLKVLKNQEHGKFLLLYGGVVELVAFKLKGKITHRVTYTTFAILQLQSTCP